MKEIPSEMIIMENKARRDILSSPYDAYTGIGSPIERMKITYMGKGSFWSYEIPITMYNENKEFIDKLEESGSIEDVVKGTGISVDQFIILLTQLRFKYDFEFWAFTTVKIQDKESKLEIPFRLNRPQRRVLSRFEKMRIERVPIRAIILKARQWGGSTFVQIYMAWIQLIHRTNWHSAIIADVEDQARNIRGMYSRLASRYPESIGKIEFNPFEGSTKNRVIKGRNCIVGVGSVQKPDSLRSFDFAMTHMCIAPGTLIPTKDGFLKKIEELGINDQVITHTGAYAKIKSVTGTKPNEFNGSGSSINITPWLGHPINMTPNHPVFTNRGWVQASDLKKSDMLSMPVRRITNEIKEIKLGVTKDRVRGGGIKSKEGGKVMPISTELGFAFGYYLAEGSLHYNKAGANEIQLSRHDKETSFGDRAVKALTGYFSSHYRKKRIGTLTTLETIYGTVLARFIDKELGVKANKRIPDWFFKCGEEFLKGVLEGYLSGDGSKSNEKQDSYELASIRVTTVSSSLAMQIRDVAASLGLGWAAIDKREKGNYYGRNCKKTYIVRWAGKSARNIRNLLGWYAPYNGHSYSEKTIISDGFVWIKIRKIEASRVDLVYDVEVDHTDHSFRTIYFSVKNSEVGLWKSTPQKSAEDLVQGVRATVPDVPDSLAVLESTAKGVGNFFHREWQVAVSGESSYDPIFVPWHEIERYQKHIPDIHKFITWVKGDEYAMYLWSLGATLEGIKWYFDTKRGENYDDWRMKSEFPSTAEEAFQSTGRRVFAPGYVQLARKTCQKPLIFGDMFPLIKGKEAFDNMRFEPSDKGLLLVWEKPDTTVQVSDRYVVVVDIGGRTDKADWSVIKVFDRYWMMDGGKPVVVATWRGHIDQDLVSWKAAQIAKWYNNALLVVESNSLDTEETEGDHFLTVLDEIVKFYPNIYARVDPEKVRQGIPIKYGFQTNMSTKPMVIDLLNGALREEMYYERDLRACDEFDTYEIKPNGKYGAVDGCHDDLVMATAIGLWICFKHLPTPHLIERSAAKTSKKIVSEASI